MNVLQFAKNIYHEEVNVSPFLKHQQNIIYTAAVLHDMCDKKYMDEKEGIWEIDQFLKKETDLTPLEISISKEIMNTMSYSKVKKQGFPNLGGYQKAYHIVREADLLSAYDFDRCMIYKMSREHSNLVDSYEDARELFENRVLKHNHHGLFLLPYSKMESARLHNIALNRIQSWKSVIH